MDGNYWGQYCSFTLWVQNENLLLINLTEHEQDTFVFLQVALDT